MAESQALTTLGMTEDELTAYLEELLQEEAAHAATENNSNVAEELESTGFLAARAAASYTVRLIAANNAYLTRHLLDLGLLAPGDGDSSGV